MNFYLRSNNLVAGKIEANKPCFFIGKCIVEHENCPSNDNLKDKEYDCPAARMQSLILLKFKKE